MSALTSRVTTAVTGACLFFVVAAAAVGVAGVIGVRSATQTGRTIASDELQTANVTAQVGRSIDAAYQSGSAIALGPTATTHLVPTLYNVQIPAVESGLAELLRLHADDGAAEQADLNVLTTQWGRLRNLLNAELLPPDRVSGPVNPARLASAYQPLNTHIGQLIEREVHDGRTDQSAATAAGSRTTAAIAVVVGIAVLVSLGLAWFGSRRIRRAVEPAQDQVEFADTLQLAEGEVEAHRLLQGYLERGVAGTAVTILNRNNSADRLEAVTELPSGSCLTKSLQFAEPRSCLAVRSARVHDEDGTGKSLLVCAVCGPCPGNSVCTPLTVGGEVIGSVLVNRPSRYNTGERQRIRDSVAQAAPVLANLRNLAIAELRAATDSLTGLPNKRAVGDTLKRMLAQASRTLSPLALLLLDLDHFKDINDRYGHPVGDQALANVGAAIRSALRESDFAGRNGGEEFAVLLPDTSREAAVITAEKIRAAIAEASVPGLELAVTASVGIAVYPEHATSSERLERLADAALYVAKQSGRDRIEIAAPPSDSGISRNGTVPHPDVHATR